MKCEISIMELGIGNNFQVWLSSNIYWILKKEIIKRSRKK